LASNCFTVIPSQPAAFPLAAGGLRSAMTIGMVLLAFCDPVRARQSLYAELDADRLQRLLDRDR